MADTVAVMNAGRIEQLGAPADLYEYPATAFVANFLGQSNLLAGEAAGPAGDRGARSTAHGVRFSVPADRARADRGPVYLGVRPEKLHLVGAADQVPAGHQHVAGVVTDASYVGVSTQYLLRTGWGSELSAFAAEQRRRRPAARSARRWWRTGTPGTPSCCPGEPAAGRPDHPAGRRAGRARRRDRTGAAGAAGRPPAGAAATGPARAAPAAAVPAAVARRGLAAGLLRRAAVAARRRQPLRPDRLALHRVRDDLGVRQLPGRAAGVLAAVRAVVRLRRGRRWCWRCCWATRWRTRSRRRPAGGRTCCWSAWSRRCSPASWCAPWPGRPSCRTTARWSGCCATCTCSARTAGCWPPRSRWCSA